MKKTIIFGMPDSMELNEEVVKNLNHCGYEVVDVSFSPLEFKYKKFSHKFVNFLKKNFQNDYSLKRRLWLEDYIPNFEKKIKEISHADYAFFIRPDMYSIEFLEFVKQHSKKMIAYQWDGMNVFPLIKKYTHLFDSFFVFDGKDLKDDFLPLTNFYFDYDLSKKTKTVERKNVYFVGRFYENRIKLMKEMAKNILKYGYESDINVFTKKEKIKIKHQSEGINFLDGYMSFSQNLENVKDSFVLVDFLNSVHRGLSLRSFEALGYQKKLITNNENIKDYDFYNENNIFVFNEDNISEIGEFLKKPYVKIDDSIREKYSFTNWIKYVLDEEPHQKIKLP